MKKKKILFQSDYALAKTGFGRNARVILSYLYKTNKYDIVHYCCGMGHEMPILKGTPWKSIGAVPDDEQERNALERDPNMKQLLGYGAHYLDKVIKEEKPDVYIAAQDIWGVDFALEKRWYKKINSVIWTTLDSLPILPSALKAAKVAKNYWVWSNFATKAMHKEGHDHVKTVHGALETNTFYRLPEEGRKKLRAQHNIGENDFIIGFVFRNQLRKSVPNLLEGFRKFLDENPKAKDAKLLLHTYFPEGWDIPKLAKEHNVPLEKILATYVCKKCNAYQVKSYIGENKNCQLCKTSGSLVTTSVTNGVSEKELNEIYNLMDVYCHPFTSGGQEIPIQEAKLAELITLVTNYSCGEEMCEKEANSLPLEWHEYREAQTEFIKASTDASSIAEQLKKVFDMPKKQKRKMEKAGRKWVEKNFSVEVIGKQIEEFIDSQESIDFDFGEDFFVNKTDPKFLMPEIKSDSKWILSLYHNILKMDNVDEENPGYLYWMNEMEKGATRQQVEDYFRYVAARENAQTEWQENTNESFRNLLSEDDEGRRLLYVMPQSIGDVYLSTALFKSLKESYPDYNLYVATSPDFFPVLSANPYVHKVIPYFEKMDDIYFLEGRENHKGFFEVAYLPYVTTQRHTCYSHNGKSKIAYKDYKYE